MLQPLPIFLNHHAMIDCIFEQWIKINQNAEYPTNGEIPRGHGKNDYIVPFFPLYRHQDMFKAAENFGYQCSPLNDINPNDNNPNNPNNPNNNNPNNRPSGNSGNSPNFTYPQMFMMLSAIVLLSLCVTY